MIPHFEKMLYDNGPLLAVYADAAVATGDAFYCGHRLAHRGLGDARNAVAGGRLLLEPRRGLRRARGQVLRLGQATKCRRAHARGVPVFERRFGLYHAPNFEGRWHLHVYEPLEGLASKRGPTLEDVQALLESARGKLFALREQRVRPGRDEKILTSWNALMIRGMAIAAPHAWRGRISLLRPNARSSSCASVCGVTGGCSRPASPIPMPGAPLCPPISTTTCSCVDAILELLQARWRSEDLAWATQLADVVLARFADRDNGGFFFTADDHEAAHASAEIVR